MMWPLVRVSSDGCRTGLSFKCTYCVWIGLKAYCLRHADRLLGRATPQTAGGASPLAPRFFS